ncbi:MAG TPA: protein kinase, partial [Thermoanaerobaculia bacterium]
MKLASGVRLGPYEIVAPIGAGGMGEVYRARDTRLDRTVAIKVLAAEFAQDAKFRIRFEREAKAISALNDPHICALYDVGDSYLVMEYCEGKTLAKRIADGPLPLEQVLRYGIQIADALDKAHRQGIIHRDLKPSNIMITKSGVKLLDFGLAKQHIESSPAEATAQQVTEEGKILGTIQYMAPELFHGKEADARSDIFALGLVLYEMMTGKATFTASSKASLIAAILEHPPPPTDAPVPLDRLIRACLAKNPDERIQSAHDVALQLKWISEQAQPTAKAKRSFQWTLASLGLIALIVAGVLAWRGTQSARSEPGVQRFSIPIPAGEPTLKWQPLAVSPDGWRLAYEGEGTDGRSVLYVRSSSEGESRPIAGTEGADTPFFSPDGKWLAFFADRKLKKVPLNGGAPATIC